MNLILKNRASKAAVVSSVFCALVGASLVVGSAASALATAVPSVLFIGSMVALALGIAICVASVFTIKASLKFHAKIKKEMEEEQELLCENLIC